MENILITGANGLLGQKLVQLLAKDPAFNVIATGQGPSRLPDFKGRYFMMDITDPGQVLDVFRISRPRIVINTAAMTNVDQCEQERIDCWKINVDGVENLVQAAEEMGSFFLHLSTDFIFDGSHGPLDENAIPGPVNFYGESKLAAEKIVEKSKLPWAIARTVLVYGIAHDMSRSNIILWVKNSLEQQKPIKVVNDQWRTPTLAEDLAAGCYLIAQKKAEGIFHLSGKDLLTPYEMAVKTADYFGLDKSCMQKVDSTIFTQPAKRPPKTGFIIDKATKELGYQPHSFDEGIGIVARQVEAMQG